MKNIQTLLKIDFNLLYDALRLLIVVLVQCNKTRSNQLILTIDLCQGLKL